jgi:hypothetical protein
MDLPTSFSRDDLVKLGESKQAIYDDHAKYVEEHINDEQYRMAREEQIRKDGTEEEKQKRIEKAKKELSKRKKK